MDKRPVGNICRWPVEEQVKLQIELRTNQLILGLKHHKVTRREIEIEREKLTGDQQKHFTEQLNKWLNFYKMRGKTNDQTNKTKPLRRRTGNSYSR